MRICLLLLFLCTGLGLCEEEITFTWTAKQTSQLREARVSWDTMESGAPCLESGDEYGNWERAEK